MSLDDVLEYQGKEVDVHFTDGQVISGRIGMESDSYDQVNIYTDEPAYYLVNVRDIESIQQVA